MQSTTPTRALADHLMNGGLDAFVADRRASGVAWRRIALELFERTGVDITEQTLRNWYAGKQTAIAS